MIDGLPRTGQVWTVDFALSLVLFIVTMLISYSMVTNTIDDTSYEDVVAQVEDASTLLVSQGYPTNWTNNSMIRLGIVSDGVLSLRKLDEIAKLSQNDVRRGLRATDYVYAYFVNGSGTPIALTSVCGFGDITVSSVDGNATRNATSFSVVPNPVSDGLNSTVYADDGAFTDFLKSDVIVLEGNLTPYSAQSPEKMTIRLEDLSKRGITLVVIGDPGFSFAGIDVYTAMTNELHVQGNAGDILDFEPFETLNVSSGVPISVPVIFPPTGEEIGDYKAIALTDGGEVAIASWIYNDARVFFISTSAGKRESGQNLNTSLAATINGNMIIVPVPSCGDPSIPTTASQVVHKDRLIPFHDNLLVLRTLVWRDRG